MKKENEARKLVFRDTLTETTAKRDLEVARQALQSLLNEWQKLNIGDCQDINQLLMQTDQYYANAIDKLIVLPDLGQRFAVDREKYKQNLKLPDQTQLIAMAKKIRQITYCAVPDLFKTDGKTVSLDEGISAFYITMNNVYADTPESIQLVEEIVKFCEIYNSLNRKLKGKLLPQSPGAFRIFVGQFILKQSNTYGLFEIEPDPAFLRKVIQG
ncbi:MAG TPA: hypothetical protein VMT63_05755 [Bacteroidales bacterium]|nr:hypothetical protein [Bacteroidales bacterium]